MADLMSYVKRRAAHHEVIDQLTVPVNGMHGQRLRLGLLSYRRTADDVAGTQQWLGKGEFECGKGIFTLNTAPQGKP